MEKLVEKWLPTSIPVIGGEPFYVRRIFCVGRNYAAHAREMGHDPDRELPFFFMKPLSSKFFNSMITISTTWFYFTSSSIFVKISNFFNFFKGCF